MKRNCLYVSFKAFVKNKNKIVVTGTGLVVSFKINKKLFIKLSESKKQNVE
jgi:hypothetical protein